MTQAEFARSGIDEYVKKLSAPRRFNCPVTTYVVTSPDAGCNRTCGIPVSTNTIDLVEGEQLTLDVHDCPTMQTEQAKRTLTNYHVARQEAAKKKQQVGTFAVAGMSLYNRSREQ